MNNQWFELDTAARLEGISVNTLRKRIQRGKYNSGVIEKTSRPQGGYRYRLHFSALSENAQAIFNQEEVEVPEEEKARKRRADAGTTSTNEKILFRCAAMISTKRASSTKKLSRNYGYKEVYEDYVRFCKDEGSKVVGYRRFIQLVKPFVDKEIQKKVTKGSTRYRAEDEMVLRHDYSSYEPMQFIQSDHSQMDAVCNYNGKVIRVWTSFHNSLGDRVLSYPTLTQRPDSYSLADDLSNFVQKYGLSQKPVIYKSDHGKAMKSRLMTKKEGRLQFEDVEVQGYEINEAHRRAMKLMGMGQSHDKGMVENLGMIYTHSTARLPRTKLLERNFGIGGTMEWFLDRPEYTGRMYQEKPEELEKNIKSGNIWSHEEMAEYIMKKVDEYNSRRHQGVEKEAKGKWAVPHIYNLDVDYFQNDKRVHQAFKGYIPETMADVLRILNDPEWSRRELGTELYSPMWRRKVFLLCGWQSRALPSKETMMMMAMGEITRTVHNYGIVINNNLYINYKLKSYIHKPVVCRYHPSDVIRIREDSGKEKIFLRELYVFDKLSEEFICIAEPHPMTTPEVHARGYSKRFLMNRAENEKELSTAKKITSEIAQGHVEKVEDKGHNIVSMQSPRDMAAKEMTAAKERKRKQKEVEEAQKEADIHHIQSLYGKPINSEE